jgi:hypothetical protein
MVLQELNMEESLEGGQYILQTSGQVVTGEEVVTEQHSVKSDILWKSILNHLFQIRTVKVILQWFSGENKV